MIVLDRETHFSIIFQRAHGMLAAKIAEKLEPALRPPAKYWLETLVAIADHDDGRRGWNGDFHLNDKGFPKDFTEFGFDYEQAVRVVNTAECKSSWVCLMVSMHLVELYSALEEAKKLVEDELARQKKLREFLHLPKEDAEAYYRLVKWCDELSLRVCKEQFPDSFPGDFLEKLPRGKSSYLGRKSELVVYPWVFEKEKVCFEYEYRDIPKREYKDDSDLREELTKAKICISPVDFKRGDVTRLFNVEHQPF
ncbi:DUF3891 family protein [Litoribacter ruber]|uniref:DUF3891 family protein n=1 Tax=Litoribacter ruber TaxID=702568 RepID=A0AAP2CM20_9BACT|nr:MULTISPECIES: DUF3891 family protein [Litoribacter]MBS9525761.1 DUF3891 family protein [Litoribacter alkaliphilus]MBT0810182.1 DUF3891 family protein [Litoribacter ruber]